jgi:YfiH family protein
MTPEYLTHPALGVRHGFFTRRGGVSAGPYASLNASLSGGDDRALVSRNRALVAQSLGVAAAGLVGVVTVTEAWPEGQGPEADALVTARPGLALGVITADCAPVLLCDAQAGVIGAAHAGWRGAAGGVLEAVIEAMVALGAAAPGISAVIGPCIGPDSYEVGPDLRDAVLAASPDAGAFFRPGKLDRLMFDLAGYCAARLTGAGAGQVDALCVDTLPEYDRFFSHRRRTLGAGGPIGHQISAIIL